MRFLLVPVLCVTACLLLALGYWELYGWVHPASGGDATYGRALATLFTLTYAVVAGLLLGGGTAFWGHRRGKSFNRTLTIGLIASLTPPAVLFLLSFLPV